MARAAPGAVRLHGVVRDGRGDPVPDALLEIRQADPTGQVPTAPGSLHRDGAFTGWGRAATDAEGRYAFVTVEPGATRPGAARVVAGTGFARGRLDRVFTRAYLPDGHPDDAAALGADPLLTRLDADARSTLLATRDDAGDLRFDVHLQGPRETVFLTFPAGP